MPPQTEPCAQAEKQKRPREDEVMSPPVSLEPALKRTRTVWKTISDARVDHWREHGTWPHAEQEETMDRFRRLVQDALARKKSSASLRRKRSDASTYAETVVTPSDRFPREQKDAPYRHPRYAVQLSKRGSFMGRYKDISAESKELCQKLLKSPQSPPKDSLFEDDLLEDILDSIANRNEARVIRDIAQLIVPSAEILAIRGAKHLKILRETVNAGWNNAIPFYGARPQPDYGLGFKREAFTKEQLQKLEPFIGDDLEGCSHFAATDDMYFPFLTSEAKCRAGMLDIADLQNAHSQTVSSRGLYELFRLVRRERELHNTISGFSYSHSGEDVRIWAHLIVIHGDGPEFYREPVTRFEIRNQTQADNRWTGWTVTMNIFDLWVPDHFKLICSAIDMLPAGLDFEVSELSELQSADPAVALSRSGLSQQLDEYNLANDGAVSDTQLSVQQLTLATATPAKPNNPKKKKTK